MNTPNLDHIIEPATVIDIVIMVVALSTLAWIYL